MNPPIARKESSTYSATEVARILGVSRDAIYREIAAKRIPSIRIGRRWLISRKYLDGLLEVPA